MLALIVVTVVASLGAAFLQVSSALTSRQTSEVETSRAFYLAEAGLAEAFQAVRIGRTGQVGSEQAPAAFGDGLVWVDVTQTADGRVRLTSTGMWGPGRATLALVVEPVEVPLGFFSDQDLVVESVLMVDGFNSEEATYEQLVDSEPLVVDPGADPFFYADPVHGILFYEGSFHRYSGSDGNSYWTDHSVDYQELVGGTSPDGRWGLDPDDFIDEGPPPTDDWDVDKEYGAVLEYFSMIPLPENPLPMGEMGPTSGDGGLLSSNGNVVFSTLTEEPVEVWGDVTPGEGGAVHGTGGALITGSTEARAISVELPEVQVPTVDLAAPVRHAGILPMLVPQGTSGHERIEVAADAELVLRGPATVVIGDLILEPGGLLSLDTRDGDVALYITGGMDLQPGSVVTTSSDYPDELSVQVAPIPTGVDGAPVKLDATSQFHGTIYAPQTDVRVGSDFEVYGGIVARRLELGAGAKLHFDSAEYEGSPVPRLLSWRIVELPSAVRGRRGDPYELLGVERGTLEALSEAHDLASVYLSLTYEGHDGVTRSFAGTEDLFDWTAVAAVLSVERDPTRPGEELSTTGPEPEPAPEEPVSPEQALLDLIEDTSLTSAELSAELLAVSPLSDTALLAAIAQTRLSTMDLYLVLEKCGPPKVGYPDAAGDSPISATVLLELIGSDFASKELSWVLEHNSPLSAAVLEAAETRNPPMSTPHLNTVRRAQ